MAGFRDLAVASASLTLAAGLAACGGDGGSPPEPSSAAAPPAPAEVVPTAPAQPPEPAGSELQVVTVAEGLSRPVLVASPPGDERLFALEQTGRVLLLGDGGETTTVLDLEDDVSTGNEQGLLGLAFDPAFAENGRLYVNYTDLDGNTHVVRYTLAAGAGQVDPASATELLMVEQPFANHNGGHLEFGPDGYLYVGLGDGGGGGDPDNRAQDTGTLLGKLLRLDVAADGGGDGSAPVAIPPDNPFANGGGRPEIWALGLRNPWRFSFDSATGDLWIGDVGQGSVEEVNRVEGAGPPATNYGWRLFEGTRPFADGPVDEPAGYVPPVAEYEHGELECSVTGGLVVRDPHLGALAGRYLFGDYCSGRVWAIGAAEPESGATEVTGLLGGPLDQLSSFGVDSRQRVYVVQLSGRISRLEQR